MFRLRALTLAALPLLALLLPAPASAQATRTWVSGVGDDANPCSRTAPCKTFAGAISKTAAGGEINVLDPGGFGGVTITKSITISSEGFEAGVLVSGTTGILVNAGANDVVILRGLDFDGVGTGLHGIRFLQGAALHVQNCQIRNFRAAGAGNGNGINFANSVTAELYVTDTAVINNGDLAGGTGGGILIQPTGTAQAKVTLERVRAENNRFGIRADSNSGTGGVAITIKDSHANGNSNSGIVAAANAVAVNMMIDRSVMSNNVTGLNANGAAALIRIGNSVISGNTSGVIVNGGGAAQSYKTNQIDGNGANGTPLPQVNLN